MSADDQAAHRDAQAVFRAAEVLGPFEHPIRLATTGTTVPVEEVGAGEPVLLLHGGPDAGTVWAPTLEHLQGLRCMLVDQPGAGRSGPYPITATT